MKKVIYSYMGHDERRVIVDSLKNKYDWRPAFFLGNGDMQKWVDEYHTDAVYHDETLMRQSNFDYSKIGDPAPIDEELIEALLPYQSRLLSWLQDTTGWNFSFSERRRYYYDVLKYWNTVIKNLKPDIFIAYTWPHCPTDYPLYLLCKYYYHIPVVFLNPIPFFDSYCYVMADSLEDLSSPFKSLYLSDDILELSDTVRNYFDVQRSSKAHIPKNVSSYYQRLDAKYRNRYKDYARIFKMILNGTAFKKSLLSFKKNKEPWDSDASKLKNYECLLLKSSFVKRNKSLRKVYDSYVEPVDLNKEFIYFAAPYQPEVPSNLCAGVYEDVFLMLDMISHVIPDDWVIYYKEHPNTLKLADKGSLSRDKYFYKKVNAYKNVKIVSHEISTFSLIDSSQAVCTVGGTVGWEAVVRNKPALVFGSVWFGSCKSIFKIKGYDDVVSAIKRIHEGFVPCAKDVERYAEAVYRVSEKDIVSVSNYYETRTNGKNRQQEMERVADAFYGAYKKFFTE